MKQKEIIAKRLKKVLEYSGLEPLGLSILIGKDLSHIYSILSNRRRITEDIVSIIGSKMDFDGSIILDPSIPIPKEKIENSPTLNEFKVANIEKANYFLNTKMDRSINSFIEDELLKSKIFDGDHKYVNEINRFCKNQFGRDYTSGDLTRGLNYVVDKHVENFKLEKPLKIKRVLKSEKRPFRKKDNTYGIKMVNVYYIEKR